VSFAGLDHVGFAVCDLDRSVAWYTELLQRPPRLRKVWDVEYVGRVVGYPGWRMECAYWELADGSTLELIEYLEPRPGRVDMEPRNAGNAHLCLITADLRSEFERLRGHARFRHPEPIEIPWGPYAGAVTCYAVDPDGILIQLMQPPARGRAL
jgi:catechol 2,3-dioxygenase-like lactoylglutathione lyase family enzyme